MIASMLSILYYSTFFLIARERKEMDYKTFLKGTITEEQYLLVYLVSLVG